MNIYGKISNWMTFKRYPMFDWKTKIYLAVSKMLFSSSPNVSATKSSNLVGFKINTNIITFVCIVINND